MATLATPGCVSNAAGVVASVSCRTAGSGSTSTAENLGPRQELSVGRSFLVRRRRHRWLLLSPNRSAPIWGALAEYGRREEERGRTQGAQRRLTGRAGYERT
jgi:hypothetical protein